jgi:fibronectin type 3 domain-containing protein
MHSRNGKISCSPVLTVGRFFLGGSLLGLFVVSCDRPNPLEPTLEAAAVGAPGPKAPSGTDVTPINSSSTQLTWIDNSTNEDGFRVERSATSTGPWEAAGNAGRNATSIGDGGRKSDQQVCYRVIALKGKSTSVPSNTDCTIPPAASTNLSATAADHQAIDLAWHDNAAAEDGYEVQRAAAETGPYGVIANLPVNAVKHRDSLLNTNTTYWYRVRAKKDGGFGDFANLASATPVYAPPKAPSAAHAKPAYSSTLEISWVDNSTNEKGFRIERSIDGGSSWTAESITGQPNATSHQSYGAATEQQACYRVIAFNDQGDSPPSNTACTTPPAEPTALTASGVDQQTIALRWSDNSAVEDGYALSRHANDGVPSIVIDLPANSTSYRDSGVRSNTTYWYLVHAKKDGGFSGHSNVASAAAASMPPSAPSEADARPVASSWIAITWSDNSTNEDVFRVERSTDGGASWAAAGDTLAGELTWIDVGRTSEQQVCYRVMAVNAQGGSPPSNVDCATPPAAPTNFTATRVNGGVELTWTDNSAVEEGYLVMLLGGMSQFDYPLPANTTSYLAAGEVIDWCTNVAAQKCTISVAATKDGGQSDFSGGELP